MFTYADGTSKNTKKPGHLERKRCRHNLSTSYIVQVFPMQLVRKIVRLVSEVVKVLLVSGEYANVCSHTGTICITLLTSRSFVDNYTRFAELLLKQFTQKAISTTALDVG